MLDFYSYAVSRYLVIVFLGFVLCFIVNSSSVLCLAFMGVIASTFGWTGSPGLILIIMVILDLSCSSGIHSSCYCIYIYYAELSAKLFL